MVGPPKVINKRVDDKLLEPYEVTVDFNLIFVLFEKKNKFPVTESVELGLSPYIDLFYVKVQIMLVYFC